jgi:hypothetical protein
MVRLVCFDAIKTWGRWNSKRGIGTFVSSQANDGLGLEVISIQQMVNPMTYAFTNNFQSLDANGVEQTSVHGVGSGMGNNVMGFNLLH